MSPIVAGNIIFLSSASLCVSYVTFKPTPSLAIQAIVFWFDTSTSQLSWKYALKETYLLSFSFKTGTPEQ
jgi:hypothetical protein